MFLTHDDNIKWKKLGIAFILTLALVFLGIFWFDVPIHNWLPVYNYPYAGTASDVIFGHIVNFMDKVFEMKVWLVLSAVAFGVAFAILMFTNNARVAKRILFVKDFKHKKPLEKLGTSAFCVFVAVAMAAVVVTIMKYGFGRMRPIFYDALDLYGFVPGSNAWAFFSFPSGHAAASFAGFVMLGLLFPRAKAVTWTLAILIGMSRLLVGAHWTSDVLMGAFIGMIAADFAKVILLKFSNLRVLHKA